MTITNNPLNDLLAAVINRALDDIQGKHLNSKRQAEPDHAIAFVLSETCESYCLYLGINYEAVQEKAISFYRRMPEKEKPTFKIKRPEKRNLKPYRQATTRQSPGKLHSVTYR